MLDAVVGAVIMVVATTSLLYSIEIAERAFDQAGRYPLNSDEMEMLRGIGFDKNNIKEILNPYYTTKKNGTGLGLSIVNKIINDHKGELEFIPITDGAKIQIRFYLNDNRNINS